MLDLNKLRNIDALKISLASPEEILEWSYGEVLKPETINYRSHKPEKDGLFCERIFGPVKDYECACGKYKRIRYKGVKCDRCGVRVTSSKVRRERMGHINLAVPVAHVWFFKNIPSIMAAVLGMSPKNLEFVIYFSSFVVLDIDHDAKAAVMDTFEEKVIEARANAKQEIENKIAELQSEADGKINSILGKTKESKASAEDKEKIESIREKLESKIADIKKSEPVELERAELEIRKIEKKLGEVDLHTVMTDAEHILLEEYLDEFCEVGIGAEAIKTMLEQIDIETEISNLKTALLSATSSNVKKLARRLKILETLRRSGVKPSSMIISVLPVIPPDLRPMVQLDAGRFATSDLNDLYRRIINRNNRLKRLLDLGAPGIIISNEKRMLQEAVDALIDSSKVRKTRARVRKEYRSLADSIKGKQGYFRANLLGKRVDYSGRAVIVSGPELEVNQCGIPREMALELFRPFVIREIIHKGYAPNMKTAKFIYEARGEEIWSILEDLVKDRPVLLNRAPTLHRLSIQAFFPVLTDGKAIQLHPVVCGGFNADFDGDQMAVHLPLSEEAVEETKALMLSTQNILKPADGSVVMYPSKDMVLGIYYLTSVNSEIEKSEMVFANEEDFTKAYNNGIVDLRQLAKVRVRGNLIETTIGRIFFNELLGENFSYINDKITNKQLKSIILKSIDKQGIDKTIKLINVFKNYGFKYSTKSGISLSIFDCVEPKDLGKIIKDSQDEVAKIDQNYHMGLSTSVEKSRLSQRVWQKTIDHFDETILSVLKEENPVNLIISAGASKASALQMRQISAIKGIVTDPTGKIIDMPILGNYAHGMSSFDYYLTARGIRRNYMDKGLGTADAGYLTRRLVNVAQDVTISEDDCGTTEYVVVTEEDTTPLMTWTDRIKGRTAAEDIKNGKDIIVKKGDIIYQENIDQIVKAGIKSVSIRSVLQCKATRGVCEKCYGLDLTNNKPSKLGTAVGIIAAQSIGEPGTQLTMRTFHSGGVARQDITSGLPRVEEIFEARPPKVVSIMSDIHGKVSIDTVDGKDVITIVPIDKNGEAVSYKVSDNDEVLVSSGDIVPIGGRLTNGYLDFKALYEKAGKLVTQKHIIEEIQAVYGSQGVQIDDKHVEVIVRQMFNHVVIADSGDTTMLPGDVVKKTVVQAENERVKEEGGQLATFEPILLGISKASRLSDSWLDAASFEQTAVVLTESAIAGNVDGLIGLKENVIIGRRIPVGSNSVKKERIKDAND